MRDNKSNKKSLFWKIYGIVVAVVMVIFVAIWIVLWNFTSVYEKSRPDHAMEKVLEMFKQSDSDSLYGALNFEASPLESEDAMKAKIIEETGDGDWTFSKKAGEYSKSAPVYQVKKDGKSVAVVHFSLDEKRGGFNTPKWNLDYITGFLDDVQDYVITVPDTATVMVNGNTLDESYVTERGAACSNLANVSDYTTVPTMTQYTVTGLHFKPEIHAIGAVYGSELVVAEEDGNSFEYSFESDEGFAAERTPDIETITTIYGKYINAAAKFSDLSGYVYPYSPAYTYLQSIQEINIWTGTDGGVDVNDLKVYNFQNYTDSCFACEVDFNHVIHMNSGDRTTPTHMRYVFVKRNGKWVVADMSLKK